MKSVFKRGINDHMTTATITKINQVIPDQSAPALEFPFDYAQQSIIQPADSTITDFSYAILPQPVNQPIVPSTLATKQISGYAVAAAPDNECPIAIILRAGGQPLNSNPIILLPGMVFRPHGVPRKYSKDAPASFSGVEFGLPFGWLGGGVGRLLVFRTEDSLSRYITGGTVDRLFHTESFKILAADQTTTLPNWPRTFPWLKAKSQLDKTGAVITPITAQGAPGTVTVKESYVFLELVCNAAGLADGTTVSVYGHRNGLAVPIYDEVVFPSCPNGSNSYVIVSGGVLNSIGGDLDYINFVSGDATIQSYAINAYRYGILG